MIYGLVPVGGKGVRLSLPYSKEMLPQKNHDSFNPVINHTVQKMELAGADMVVFVHGKEFKEDIKKHFEDKKYLHVTQEKPGFANVLMDFWNAVRPEASDRIVFGLPDSVYDGNPFVEMLHRSGVVCGLFTTDDDAKVDRLCENGAFQVKSPRNDSNSEYFWGVLKFDGRDISTMIEKGEFERTSEIGDILNGLDKSFVRASSYVDLGTWAGYNRYLHESVGMSSTEIEKKYDAEAVSMDLFDDFVRSNFDQAERQELTSDDYYFTNGNQKIEFIRFREAAKPGWSSDITIKNFKNSQFNRFELVLKLHPDVKLEQALQFIGLNDAKFMFKVKKHCIIYYFDYYTIVMYEFSINSKTFKIIEVELNGSDMGVLRGVEAIMSRLDGFNKNKTINVSKFQLIKNELGV